MGKFDGKVDGFGLQILDFGRGNGQRAQPDFVIVRQMVVTANPGLGAKPCESQAQRSRRIRTPARSAVAHRSQHGAKFQPCRNRRPVDWVDMPVAKPGLGEQAMSALTAASQRSHVGLGPCLINEDKVLRINRALILLPPRPLARDIGAVLFTGQHAFFEAEASPAQTAPNGIVRDLYAFGPKLVARRRP
jgi:hypothetical protein